MVSAFSPEQEVRIAEIVREVLRERRADKVLPVAEIIAAYQAGASCREVARQFDCSFSTVARHVRKTAP